jgi:putative ABC transport system permease protein
MPEPGESPGTSQVLAVVAVMGLLGLLSIFLSGFLIFNTLSALLTQHVRQIGIMKAVGARKSQVVMMYLVLILIFSALATIPAIFLAGYVASVLVSGAMAVQFNYTALGFRMTPEAVIVQIAIGLFVPLSAGLLPVLSGTRITIHEALSNYGLGKGKFGRSLVDRMVESIRGLSRPMLISLRNTFRRKGRLALTLVTLILGGAVFIGVYNLRASLVTFIDQIGKYILSDVNVTFMQSYPVQKVEELAMQIPGVDSVEAWTAASGIMLREDGSGSETVQILAPPVDSKLLEPVMLRGRWVQPGDENAIVVSNSFWEFFPDLDVGDEIHVKIGEKETKWTVVGFFQFPSPGQLISYTSYEYLSHLMAEPNRTGLYRIVGKDHSPAAQGILVKQVEQTFKSHGLQVYDVQAGSSLVEANTQTINVIVGFFMFNAILVALVGGIGLMGTMSMNVIERTREIGVMRAIGASDGAILRLVIVEGMLIGVISWILGALLAVPISHGLYGILSQVMFQTPGKATIDANGFVIWLVIALVISALASLLPARNAARLTVREILAYE